MAALNMKLMTAGADKIYREPEFPIVSLNIKRDESAADMLEVKLVGEVKEFPSFLRVYLEGNMIFDGITDDLIFSRSDEGEFTELVARDMFSLLTDNELRPGSLRNPSLRLFAERFLAPLGFEIRGNMASFRGELVIKEGCSVFRGLADFCKSFMGAEAKRRGNVLYCGVERPVVRVEDKYPVLSFERTISRFAVASKLYVKSSTSAIYSGCRENKEDMGFVRCFYGDGALEPKEYAEICLAGGVDICPGDVYGKLLTAESVRINYNGTEWLTRIKGKELKGNVDT